MDPLGAQASASDLTGVLSNWAASGRPLYRGLAGALRGAIERRELPPGACLPPERALAGALAVSRSTVVGAYELLKGEGLLSGRQGSGTYVGASPALGRGVQTREPGDNAMFRRIIDGSRVDIDFTVAATPASPELAAAVGPMLAGNLDRVLDTNGYLPQGLPELREAVASYLARGGVPTDPRQLLITAGAQQALALLAGHLLSPGDAVAVENPTYPGALDVFRRAQARIVPVSVTEAGLDLDMLEGILSRSQPRLLYVIPTHSNPTGAVMSDADRRRLAGISAATRIPLVEDTVVADLNLDSSAPPHIAAIAEGAPIITVGSASKLFWGGFRVGWIRGPVPLITRLTRAKTVADLGSPLIDQTVVARLLSAPDQLLAIRRADLRSRLDALTAGLRARLPDWRWSRPSGGLSLWIRLPSGDGGEFAQVALRHGVGVLPGSQLSATEEHRDHLRLAFVVPLELIDEGVERLVAAWTDYSTGSRLRSEAPQAVV